jgi:two-component system, OmpR family, alkaline phosphatase synthesis response regulator PhoP
MNQSDLSCPIQGWTFNPETFQVFIGGTPISLTKTEFGILNFLASQQGNTCSRRQIIDAVQGEDYPVTERSVDVQIASIRRKLGEAGRLMETVRGKGFRFQEEPAPQITSPS